MGHSPTIKDLSRTNAEFKKFLKQISTDAERESKKIKKSVHQMIDDRYKKNGRKAFTLTETNAIDVKQMSEYSLERISTYIDKIYDMLFLDPSDASSEKIKNTSIDKKAQSILSTIKGSAKERLISIAALYVKDLIKSVLDSFGGKTSVDQEIVVKQRYLHAGVTVFVGCMRSSFHRSDFFSNKEIVSIYFYVKVCFCHEETVEDIDLTNDSELDDKLNLWKKELDKINSEFAAGKISMERYLMLQTFYQSQVDQAELSYKFNNGIITKKEYLERSKALKEEAEEQRKAAAEAEDDIDGGNDEGREDERKRDDEDKSETDGEREDDNEGDDEDKSEENKEEEDDSGGDDEDKSEENKEEEDEEDDEDSGNKRRHEEISEDSKDSGSKFDKDDNFFF